MYVYIHATPWIVSKLSTLVYSEGWLVDVFVMLSWAERMSTAVRLSRIVGTGSLVDIAQIQVQCMPSPKQLSICHSEITRQKRSILRHYLPNWWAKMTWGKNHSAIFINQKNHVSSFGYHSHLHRTGKVEPFSFIKFHKVSLRLVQLNCTCRIGTLTGWSKIAIQFPHLFPRIKGWKWNSLLENTWGWDRTTWT